MAVVISPSGNLRKILKRALNNSPGTRELIALLDALVANDNVTSETVVSVSPVTISPQLGDQVVLVDVVPCVVNLPPITTRQGRIIIKDRTGNATAGDPITLTPDDAGENIDGQSTQQIKSGHAAFWLHGQGTTWSIL